MTAGNISQLERGTQGYSQSGLEALAEAYGCDPGQLLSQPPPNDANSVGMQGVPRTRNGRIEMAKKAKKHTARGRQQDRARVAGEQDYEVRYAAKKTRKSAAAVKKAVKKVGSSRKRVVKALKRGRR